MPVEPSKVPLVMVRLPTVSFTVPMPSVPPATVTAAPSERRLADPRLSVPPFTLTVPAPSAPFNVVVPNVTVAVPAPRLPVTVPPCRA